MKRIRPWRENIGKKKNSLLSHLKKLCDNIINIHSDQVPNNCDVYEPGCNPKTESQSDVCLLRL
jgi:hypothetical protein